MIFELQGINKNQVLYAFVLKKEQLVNSVCSTCLTTEINFIKNYSICRATKIMIFCLNIEKSEFWVRSVKQDIMEMKKKFLNYIDKKFNVFGDL